MKTPILFLLEPQADLLEPISRALDTHYQNQYQLLTASSGVTALDLLQDLAGSGATVALFLVTQTIPGMSGPTFLAAARKHFPDARRVLLAEALDTETAILSINEVGIDRYLVNPWNPSLALPILDELLEDWRANIQIPYLRVKGVMTSRPARIRAGSNLYHAAEIVALSGASDLMVVDDDGQFVGVLSEGDILRAALPDFDEIEQEGGSLLDAYQLFLRKGQELSEKPIAPLIIRNPITLHPDDHVAKAAVILINKQIRRLPVVKNGHLLGTISRANICQSVVGDW
ncbi:MAG TPA: CBS domain-containing protein [Anaerolineales bacterium]|nr:CBS domain-containing protein [Anaerolineales bacterium]